MVTFGLLAVLGWLASRYGQKLNGLPRLGGGSASPDFTVIARLSLNAQNQLHHVRFKNVDLLIGTGPQGQTLLYTSPPRKTK